MLRNLICVALFIYFGIILSLVVDALPLHVVDDKGREITVIHSISKAQTQYITVDDLFEVLDPEGEQQYIGITKHLTLNLKGRRFDFRIGQTSFNIDREEARSLSYPPLLIDNQPMIPIEFITEFASQFFGFQAKFNATAQRLQILEEKIESEGPKYPVEDTEGFLLIIDPGHGGKDTGSRSRNRLIEKKLTLKVASQLAKICRKNQIQIKLTRSSDQKLSPQQRADIANKSDGELFISLHFNASFSPKRSGFRIYVNKPVNISSDDSQSLTQESEEELKIKEFSQSEFFDQSKKVARWITEELQTIKLNGETIEVPLATLRRVYMPAVLIELGYLTNLADEAEFSDQETIDAIVKALFNVVHKFSKRSNVQK